VQDPSLQQIVPSTSMPMRQTAEVVARRYDLCREPQDASALQSRQRTAAAQRARRFDLELVPVTAVMSGVAKETGQGAER
jgi:acetyl-CoA acetyltransferase